MKEIEKEIEEFKYKIRECIDDGGFIKEDRRGIEIYVLMDWIRQALLRTEKRAREERDKEIINRLDIILTDPNDYLRGGIENLKTFINKKNE